MIVSRAGNDAVNVNPPTGTTQHLTDHGSSWLWSAFTLTFLAALLTLGGSFRMKRGTRVFHQLVLAILTIASMAYFTMASNLGWTTTPTEFDHYSAVGTPRQIFWVRYVDWVLTAPLMVVTFLLATATPLSDILTAAFFASTAFVCLLSGALIRSSYKWGFFVFAIFSLAYVLGVMLGPGRSAAAHLSADHHKNTAFGAGFLGFMWLLWLICWACADGGNVISNDSEAAWYGVLDVLARPALLCFFLWRTRNLDFAQLQLHGGKYTNTANVAATGAAVHDIEKTPRDPNRKFFSRKGRHDMHDMPTTTGNTAVAPTTLDTTTGTGMAPAAAPGYTATGHNAHFADTAGTGDLGATRMHEHEAAPRMSEQTVVGHH